mmetsp:Transcript_41573/g.126027  ORF Transcript_41573/g.126027 Transcript_41573/m.126027 type:complete len:278 (+) Transcript_41573:1090-1923(+)
MCILIWQKGARSTQCSLLSVASYLGRDTTHPRQGRHRFGHNRLCSNDRSVPHRNVPKHCCRIMQYNSVTDFWVTITSLLACATQCDALRDGRIVPHHGSLPNDDALTTEEDTIPQSTRGVYVGRVLGAHRRLHVVRQALPPGQPEAMPDAVAHECVHSPIVKDSVQRGPNRGGSHRRSHDVEADASVIGGGQLLQKEILNGRGWHKLRFDLVGNNCGERRKQRALGENEGVQLGTGLGFVLEGSTGLQLQLLPKRVDGGTRTIYQWYALHIKCLNEC